MVISGKKISSIKDLVDVGQEIYKKKQEEEGYIYTCMGWLSPAEIKEAGLVFNNNLHEVYDYEKKQIVKEAIGYDSIPGEEYMIEDSRLGKLGSKYIGPSKKFLSWYKKRNAKMQEDNPDEVIEKQISKPSYQDETENWNINDVKF